MTDNMQDGDHQVLEGGLPDYEEQAAEVYGGHQV
jgi:hypothetical protein